MNRHILPAGPFTRVASLVPSLTETVCGLDAGERLVARTIYCVEPRDELAAVPACGGTKNPDLGRILELQPDLVLACAEENKPEHLEALAAAGIAVHTVMPTGPADVAELLEDYGRLLDARAAVSRAQADLTAARREAKRIRGTRSRPAVTLIWKDPWMGVGGGNHIDGMMTELGLVNLLGERTGYPTVTLPELVDLKPEVLLLPDEPWRFTEADATELASAGLRAETFRFDGKDLSWYGTWTAGGLRRMAARLASVL